MTTVAIDFGTSNTVVCILNPDTQTPETLRLGEMSRIFKTKKSSVDAREIPVVPTLVFVKNAGELVLGEKVRSQRLGQSQPDRFFKAFKRDLAADYQPPARNIDGESYTPESVAEQFIRTIWKQLYQQNIQPDKLIFTVPVGAFERYLDWFRDLAESLGVEEVQLIDESTAAALGYAVQRPGSLVLVVDFGGGTLDLSLVRTAVIPFAKGGSEISPPLGKEGLGGVRAEVLAKSDAYVGGEDIDIWIVEDYLRQIGSSRAEVGGVGWQNLLEIAEKLKIQVSQVNEAKESWFDDENFMSYDLQLNRDQLEEILESRQLLEQLREALDEVLSIALGKGIGKADIEQVLLVGGTSMIPAVSNLVVSYFGRQKVKTDKPFEAVAHGALALTQLASVDDYLRHTYAIRLWEPYAKAYTYSPIFSKEMKYPCESSEELTLQVAIEGQREIRLDIGEVAEVSQAEVTFNEKGQMTSSLLNKHSDFRSLESHHQEVCVAHLNPPGVLGIDRVSVSFEVDEKRVLLATVRDLVTGKVLVAKGAIAKLQ
ncbi:MAG: Hsp70 family protein [Microcoleus sp. PH2017_40_RAT_O_B]|uniref:Hsp70 family protein n=1 Tax=unclassified Microcoleus TaxID=2642155 RepID=UPI001D78F64A|nr:MULTISPECIES: Hsp70 family protein [unclassified Microcoleus]TAF89638.1 MAG: Hsp70 family protein [Oscillatoriales cyanobacterium]MCC3447789.1 Hsp70 family protein [Microcoleus sp. PH2017_09_SFU_O_A]MCC3572897.1 Hsp70 family protein [Microcoleus sp. PH2017_34_RAT_O_A]MCC3612756.1 Hsp70 family protein [Microcoleus sp. PH2017_40_RAT_O_B]MCC3628703.1 Hsp70 family protein [Microcoleus sp. PH2017_39_LGB_O_B]